MNKTIELTGGTTNKIYFEPSSGVVTKTFETGNGIGIPDTTRIQIEKHSLVHVPHAPRYLGSTPTSISMSYVDGERQLDKAVYTYPEGTQQHVFHRAGEILAEIHGLDRYPLNDFHQKHIQRVSNLVLRNKDNLTSKNINPYNLFNGLKETYNPEEIDKHGLVWKHGDYWLNNLMGRRVNGHYQIDGVIDWEIAGVGSPYEDFAIVQMSIEDPHPDAVTPFWKGYGIKPSDKLKDHFAVVKTLEWMLFENDETSGNFESSFYKPKIELMRGLL